mmetsp:Transcript_9391/g.25557  ORF Transcript_9391/g.25557 Transcript_9391/m.25557 type:complete len:277 (-) Transcript_9391:16-846(-)
MHAYRYLALAVFLLPICLPSTVARALDARARAQGDIPRKWDRFWAKYHRGLRARAGNVTSANSEVLFYGCLEWCRKFGREYLCASYRAGEKASLRGFTYTIICTSGDTTNHMLHGMLHGELPPAIACPRVIVYMPGPYNLITLSPLLASGAITDEEAAMGWVAGVRAVIGNLTQTLRGRTQLVVMGVLPQSLDGSVERDVMGRVNMEIREQLVYSAHGQHFLDCSQHVMVNSSSVDCSLVDCAPGHSFILTVKGYMRVMRSCLVPYLKQNVIGLYL